MPTINQLIDLAVEASENAYAPYSQFKVGAILLGQSGEIYRGANIENISYGLTNCAERTAIFSAIAAGERQFSKLLVYGNTEQAISPCGACRQVMAEFFNSKVEIYLLNKYKQAKKVTIDELLPYQFEDLR